MIKLLDILREAAMPQDKMIIMAGGAGSGKSTLINKIKSAAPGFEIINPDKYVEDKDSPMYNNLAQSSMQVDDKDVPDALANNKSFIWDTTASNTAKLFGGLYRRKEVPGLLNQHPDYDVMMIMAEINEFNEAVKQGRLYDWLEELTSKDPDQFKSTLGNKAPEATTPEEQAKKDKAKEKSIEVYKQQVEQLEREFTNISNKTKGYVLSEQDIISKVKNFAQ
jgi:hypothetical protein